MQFTFLKKRFIGALAFVAFSTFSFTTTATPIDDAVIEKITQKISSLDISVKSISPAVIDGLYEVVTNQGVYYVSKDTQFFVSGSIYDIDNQMENITAKSSAVLGKDKLKSLEKDMIVYKAEQEKHVVTVFTDISCGYCQKLHSEMADYNNNGITVRYLAFPRGGLNSATYQSMVSIWCADDPKLAMDKGKSRQKVEYKSRENSVKEQYELGQFFGVRGTPSIVLEDGSLQPGYLPVGNLLATIAKIQG
ncbi:bifunctional protein-disulfide isomerase/oxidoreductase DsbC [Psychromonas sp. KJ10-10]|uniref:bifunctional protein-disulfide isomerase/oxidoreductase DsbC n=1 Tax=Psychromonas sp. KJ10-10 TaxID=3391823 RepID=UPI0039B50DF5